MGDEKKAERDKMVSGEVYNPNDPELVQDRTACRASLRQLNYTLDYTEKEKRLQILEGLLGSMDREYPPWFEPPFYCDYGYNIHVGRNFYANFSCCFLDCGKIEIGDNVLLGPNVQLYTVNHPLDVSQRSSEYTRPIKIESNVWIGGGAIILPGITIREGAVVAAGAIVTKDVPESSLVAGNPAKVIKLIAKQ